MAASPGGDPSSAGAQLARVREQLRLLTAQSEQLAQRSRALECQFQDLVGLSAGPADQARAVGVGSGVVEPDGTGVDDGGEPDAGGPTHASDLQAGTADAGAGAAGLDSGHGPTAKKPPMSEPTRQLGARVRQRRLALGLSQQGLAERAGVHWSFVGQIERGQRNISLHNIIRLADALDINPAQLVDAITFRS